jgi:hypothetical protein
MLHKDSFKKPIEHTAKYCVIVACFLLILSGCAQKPATFTPVEVTDPTPQSALSYAKRQMGKPYKLGGQGPDVFDCSGLIICAYEDGLQSPPFLMNKRNEICNDVTIDEIYKYNVRLLEKEELIPGDIIFITKRDDRITHGGLFIGWKDENTIEFINASYFYGEVCLDEWPLEGTKRGQWFAGFGRLIFRSKK